MLRLPLLNPVGRRLAFETVGILKGIHVRGAQTFSRSKKDNPAHDYLISKGRTICIAGGNLKFKQFVCRSGKEQPPATSCATTMDG